MRTVVKSVRVKEEIWEALHRLGKEENKSLTQLLNEGIRKIFIRKN